MSWTAWARGELAGIRAAGRWRQPRDFNARGPVGRLAGGAADVVSFASNDTEVHTVVKFKSTRTANGRVAEMNLHHWFQLRDGKIAYYRGTEDTSQTEAIFRD